MGDEALKPLGDGCWGHGLITTLPVTQLVLASQAAMDLGAGREANCGDLDSGPRGRRD